MTLHTRNAKVYIWIFGGDIDSAVYNKLQEFIWNVYILWWYFFHLHSKTTFIDFGFSLTR